MASARLRIWSALARRFVSAPGLLGRGAHLVALLILCEVTSLPQQLALRRYDVSDGLAHSEVTSIYQDTKGFIWFSTFEGLSRFDGYRFINYGVQDGLPHIIVNDVRQDDHGRLWIATNGGGIALLNEAPQDGSSYRSVAASVGHKFIAFLLSDAPNANKVNRMLFDSRGTLWCVTDVGIYRARVNEPGFHFEPIIERDSYESNAVMEDSQKRLWFGLEDDLIEVSEDQTVHRVAGLHNNGVNKNDVRITGIVEENRNRLLIATSRGLYEYQPDPLVKGRGVGRKLPLTLEPGEELLTILRSRSGTLWLGTSKALVKYHNGQSVSYRSGQGLDIPHVRALSEDRDGNLWIGTVGGGVYKLINETIISYTRTDGLPHPSVSSVFEDDAGRINAVMRLSYEQVRITDGGITAGQKIDAAPQASSCVFVRQHDRHSWEIVTPIGPVRLPEPILRLRNKHNLDVKQLVEPEHWTRGFQVFEDDTETLWLVTRDGKIRRAQAPYRSVAEILSTDFGLPPTRMIRDRQGGLWLGAVGRLGRVRQGQFRTIHPTEGLPETDPRSMFVDSRGWLWVGNRYRGVSVTKEPAAEEPRFTSYLPEQDLLGREVWSIAEDDFGRMYFGTTRGLNQFDPQTNQWLRYTREDGLPSNYISHLYKDRQGYIWISTLLGVARFNPRAQGGAKPQLSIYLSRVQIAGEDLTLPETGQTHVQQLELPAARNNLLLEYTAPSFQNQASLRYQYMLESVDADWSAPTNQRSVNYARLAPGDYRFLVRAVDSEGTISPTAATLQFKILTPLWQRWWFLALTTLIIIAGVYSLYRYRVYQLLNVERMRTRIASDLHDDIGSSLSQISIISEVVRAQLTRENSSFTDPLSTIAQTSRELVDSMSDIVWAINPKRDNLLDLVHRMRHFAMDAMTAQELDIDFIAPDNLPETKIDTDMRREVFLIFKEAVNNAIRHSCAPLVKIRLSFDDGGLRLAVEDNGIGFDAKKAHRGHGLFSIRQRAERIGGELSITSILEQGTEVNLQAPLKTPRRRFI
jgi:ligand-binding sensor domain-containing protein/two-component sensor histidine kinase